MADEKSVKIPGGASPRFDAILGEQAGVPCERGQVPAHPHSGPGLPGFDPVSPEYARVPERKEDSQGYPPSGLFAGKNCPASEDLAEVSRTPVQPPRVGSYGGSPHTADPADAPRPVDTGLGQPVRTHPPERGDSCRVVDVTGQSSSWPPLPASRSDYVDRNRCLQGRVGRPPRQLGGLRALVKSLGQATHQLARASSGLANPEAFPTSVAGHCCGCHFRQSHHGCLYQQGGRDTVPVSVPSGTGRLGMVRATRHLSCGQSPVRGQERPCGCLVQGEPPLSDGVDPPQRGDLSDLSTLANPSCGPVRVGETPQAASVLLNPAVPVIKQCERADAELGMPLFEYAYPLTALVPRVLRKLRLQPMAQILLVAPFWPSQLWFCQLTSMLTDLPWAISQRDDLLKNAVTGMRYPKPEAVRLTVWPLSANPSLTAAFQQTLLTRQPEPDESQLAGFMVPVLDTTKGGAWTEVWTPLKHL